MSLGLQSHGQPRYVYVATALFVVLGVDRLARLDWPRLAHLAWPRLAGLDWPRLALGLIWLSWLGAAIAVVLQDRHVDDERAPIREAARVIRAHTGDRPCSAVAMIVPQLMWHSGCEVFASALLEGPLPADRNRYAVSFTRWPIDLAAILAAQHLHATPLPTTDLRTKVWLLQ